MKSVIPPSFQLIQKKPGNDLLSHLVPQAVPSALKGFTSVFGMGTGVSPLLWLPEKCLITKIFRKYLVINYTLNKIYGQASVFVHYISDAPNISLCFVLVKFGPHMIFLKRWFVSFSLAELMSIPASPKLTMRRRGWLG